MGTIPLFYSSTNYLCVHCIILQEYPFKARKRHGLDYIRQFPHLRARTNSFSSLLRIRHTAAMAVHDFFQKENFIQVHTPILTSSDCEGAGDLFEVRVSSVLTAGFTLMWDWGGATSFDVDTGSTQIFRFQYLQFRLGRTLIRLSFAPFC